MNLNSAIPDGQPQIHQLYTPGYRMSGFFLSGQLIKGVMYQRIQLKLLLLETITEIRIWGALPAEKVEGKLPKLLREKLLPCSITQTVEDWEIYKEGR